MADVTFKRKDYEAMLPIWKMIKDVCAGESSIHAGRETYLPSPLELKTPALKKKYDNNLKRTAFFNATGRTQESLVGAVYKRAPQVKTTVSELIADADGAGVTLVQQSQAVTSEVLGGGRHCLYVDYPVVDEKLSKAQQSEQNIKPKILEIDATSVINWRTREIGGVTMLSLVVIDEVAQEDTEDGFGVEEIKQYRVLKLDENNQYIVQIYREQEGATGWSIWKSANPTRGDGTPWREIPFIFVGARNNDSSIDKSPLYDMAVTNIHHYQNEGLLQRAAYMIGHPQPWMSGMDEDWRDYYEAKDIYFGEDELMLVPEGGELGIAQASENTLLDTYSDKHEKRMVALGARLLMKGQAVKTATEAQSDNESEHSVLSLVAENVSAAYRKALDWAAVFMNQAEGAEFELNMDFVNSALDAITAGKMMEAFQVGVLPKSDLFNNFRQGGWIDPEKTDEQINAEVANDSAGLALDDTDDDDDITSAA